MSDLSSLSFEIRLISLRELKDCSLKVLVF